MGVPRSSFYAAPAAQPAEDEVLAEIRAIADACPCYGYRRIDAELRHRGHVVNAKKIRRLMKEHQLNPLRRPRFVRTTDGDHTTRLSPLAGRSGRVCAMR